MITIMIRIVPSDMAFSPTGRPGWNPPPRSGGKAYRSPWFQRRNRTCLFRLQFQRRRIDAVAQSGRAGAIIEHVADMAVALRAQNLGPDHAMADVAHLVDLALYRRRREAWPAATGIE